MPLIHILTSGVVAQYTPGDTLLKILFDRNVIPPSPCGGTGICGKCLVTVTGKGLSAVTEEEKKHLSAEQLAAHVRLACKVYPVGDIAVTPVEDSCRHSILSSGYLPEFILSPWIRKKPLVLLRDEQDGQNEEGQLTDTREKNSRARTLERQLASILNLPKLPPHISARCKSDFFASDGNDYTAVYNGDSLLEIEPGSTLHRLMGVAVDIGTTTIVAALMDMRTGSRLGVRTAINPQKQFGFDVLTRISNIIEHGEECLRQQQHCVVSCLNALVEELCAEHSVLPKEIYAIAVAANTTMLHILCGVDPSPLGYAPYRPVFTQSKEIPAATVGLTLHPEARLYCLPSASAYVGADVVAGVYVAGLQKNDETALLIDIGTNGEMVLAHKGQLLACSCAAGPALEGMNISHGMRAAAGAIEEIHIRPGGELQLKTIDDAPALGLCGSGILSAINEFLKVGAILPKGNILKGSTLDDADPRKKYCLEKDGKPVLCLTDHGKGIFITQGDVRQVQLAKGALLAGMLSLLAQKGLTPGSIDRFFVAGQFGAHLTVDVLIGCGILPPVHKDRVEYLGNTSQSGACLALLSDNCREEIENIRNSILFVELSTLPDFEKTFIRSLNFISNL